MVSLSKMHKTLKTVLLILVALAMPIVPFVIIGELPGERWLSATDENAMAFALLGGGLLTVDVLLPIPSSIIITLLGSRLGFVEGWLSAWLGLTLGHAIGYWIGRLWPRKLAPEFPETPTLFVLFLTRPVPILAEAVSIAAGATRVPFLPTILVCALGNVIFTGVLTANGAALFDYELPLVGVILPLLVPALGWVAWRWIRAGGEVPDKPPDSSMT
jgi:uncharacterized membrane protein YdjX (TVP38/TMEM64 family)